MGTQTPAARTPSDFQIGENKWEDPNKRLFGVEGTGPTAVEMKLQ